MKNGNLSELIKVSRKNDKEDEKGKNMETKNKKGKSECSRTELQHAT